MDPQHDNDPYELSGPTTAAEHLATAELLFELERHDEARGELGQALSLDPAHVPALTLLSVLELLTGNHDEALAAATAALAAEPTHETALIARGHALALLRRPNEALDVANDLIDRAPESWWHNVHFALIVRESRNGQDALDAAWAAVQLAPDDARAHLSLAVVAANLGLKDLAERALTAAEHRTPGIATYLDDDLGPRLLRGRPDVPPSTVVQPVDAATRVAPADRAARRSPLPMELARVIGTVAAVAGLVPMITLLFADETMHRFVAAGGVIAAIVAAVLMVRRLPDPLRDGLRSRIDSDPGFTLSVVALGASISLLAAFTFTGTIVMLPFAMITALLSSGIALYRSRT